MSSEAQASPLLVGLSGVSSSGKTTLARLLRDIFPNTLVVHEDDFYLPEEQLPMRGGLKDWDCAASLDIPHFVNFLKRLKETGEIPSEFDSKEDRNEIGDSGVTAETIRDLQDQVGAWLDQNQLMAKRRRICIVDGFLLFGESVKSVRECFEVKLMLRATYEKAKMRREARSGYATIEGWWEDPEGYVDKVVWPAYVEEHAFLFQDNDVDGQVNETVVGRLGIKVIPGNGVWDVKQMLEWAIDQIKTISAA